MARWVAWKVPSPRRKSVSFKTFHADGGHEVLPLAISSANSSSMRVPLVKQVNRHSGWRSHRVMMSFLRTSGSPPGKGIRGAQIPRPA